MLLKIINLTNLSRNVVKLGRLSTKHDQLRSPGCLIRNFSTAKPNEQLKEEESACNQNDRSSGAETSQELGQEMKKKKDIEIDIFLNELEYLNLSEEEKRAYEAFQNENALKKFIAYCKMMYKNTVGFVLEELFFVNQIKGDRDANDRDIDCRWEFNGKDDIKRWMVVCDRHLQAGYSTVNLDVNRQGRLVFSGYIDCDTFPKDGMHDVTGYAHLSSPLLKSGFGMETYYNWSSFNHLIIRFRGDGRVYRILLKSASLQGMQTDGTYEYFLYTRGGPYWQTAKIPFSKFILCYGARVQEKSKPLMADKIQSFGITIAKYTGPFKLEISHIGLQLDFRSYQMFDYEGYFRMELM